MSKQKVELSDEVQQRIEESLRNWDDPGPEAQRRFEESKREWDQKLQHIQDALEASERLTAKDFSFRVGPCYDHDP